MALLGRESEQRLILDLLLELSERENELVVSQQNNPTTQEQLRNNRGNRRRR